jgi:hypothetical protein
MGDFDSQGPKFRVNKQLCYPTLVGFYISRYERGNNAGI